MEKQDIVKYFSDILEKEKDIPTGMAAIMTYIEVFKHDTSKTMQEFRSVLVAAGEAMRKTDYPIFSVLSGCELFMRYITLKDLDVPSFEECKALMLQRGEYFLKKYKDSRNLIAKLFINFIPDSARILTHAKSPVVLQAMLEAAKAKKRFKAFVTTSDLDKNGAEMCKALEEASIDCTLILDSAIGYVMEQVDMVVVGVEGVVPSGGIINTIGTFTMAVCANNWRKDFYVLAESFKFLQYFPIDQMDSLKNFKYPASRHESDLRKDHPRMDYTPSKYIRLLFTDLGMMPPSAVSYEIIKLYQ